MIDYGLEMAGFETAFQVEIDPFCRKVLEKYWPDVPRFEDVRKCGRHNLEPVDLLSGGYPCQDHSIAGKKRGLGTPDNPTERSGLWFEYSRIIRELRPRWILVENVSRLLRTEDGDRVLSDLEGAGYACWPLVLDVEVLDAPHIRERTWLVCREWASPVPVGQYPDDEGDPGHGMVEGELHSAAERALAETRKQWQDRKHELAPGNGGEGGGASEPEACAYAGVVRAVYGYPRWMDRYRACGNSVNFVVPALVGQWIARVEGRREHGQA